jgi:multidrug efflux pump subunit AcrA (membrane-fusion protein)
MTPTQRPATTNERLAALFPDLTAAGPRRWWRRRSVIGALAVAVLVLAGGAVGATQALGSTGPRYRTAIAGTHDVEAVLTGVATIEPVKQATVAFPVSGTVSLVSVTVGDTVVVGQTLAALDTTSLLAALHTKQAALAQAQLILTKALAGDDVSSLTGGGSATGASAHTTAATTPAAAATPTIVLTDATISPGAATTGSTPQLAAARQAVATAQHQVDLALATASAALASATADCAPAATGTSAGADTVPSTSTTTTTVASSTTSSTDSASCETQLTAVLAAQTAAAQDQAALASATTALDALLTTGGSTATPATTTTSQSTASSSKSNGSASSSAASTPTSTPAASATSASSPSAADLIGYQKAVDAAFAEVSVAQQAVAQATIVSPIAGTVVAVNLATGDSLAAASSTADIVVAGSGGYEASMTVGVDKIPHVAVGQSATVVPDGSTARDGKVVAISIAADAAATTTSYRVTIGLEGDTANLHNGSTATTSITTNGVAAALAVPTSAVTTTGTRHTVTVLNGTITKVTQIQVGVVGATWTQIRSGLTAGQRVVIAAVDDPLPNSATGTSSSSTKTGATTTGGPPTGFTGGPPSGGGGFGR